jgi:hypothetical protein
VASDGTLYVQFINGQNDAEWEVEFDFDSQLMMVKSTDGGVTFGAPVPTEQWEDGLSDMPWSVIGRQTVWGHQIRWASAGNIAVDPTDPNHVVVVWNDRGTANPNATDDCIFESFEAPTTARAGSPARHRATGQVIGWRHDLVRRAAETSR